MDQEQIFPQSTQTDSNNRVRHAHRRYTTLPLHPLAPAAGDRRADKSACSPAAVRSAPCLARRRAHIPIRWPRSTFLLVHTNDVTPRHPTARRSSPSFLAAIPRRRRSLVSATSLAPLPALPKKRAASTARNTLSLLVRF